MQSLTLLLTFCDSEAIESLWAPVATLLSCTQTRCGDCDKEIENKIKNVNYTNAFFALLNRVPKKVPIKLYSILNSVIEFTILPKS